MLQGELGPQFGALSIFLPVVRAREVHVDGVSVRGREPDH